MNLNRILRPTCSACNKSGLVWMPVVALVRQLPTADQREHAREALLAFGADAESWRCSDAACAEWGVFGPIEIDY